MANWDSIWRGIGELGQTKGRTISNIRDPLRNLSANVHRAREIKGERGFQTSEREAGETFIANQRRLDELAAGGRQGRDLTAAEERQIRELNQRGEQFDITAPETKRSNLANEAIRRQEAAARIKLLEAQLAETQEGKHLWSSYQTIMGSDSMVAALKGMSPDGLYEIDRELPELPPEELARVKSAFMKIVAKDFGDMSVDLAELFDIYAGGPAIEPPPLEPPPPPPEFQDVFMPEPDDTIPEKVEETVEPILKVGGQIGGGLFKLFRPGQKPRTVRGEEGSFGTEWEAWNIIGQLQQLELSPEEETIVDDAEYDITKIVRGGVTSKLNTILENLRALKGKYFTSPEPESPD